MSSARVVCRAQTRHRPVGIALAAQIAIISLARSEWLPRLGRFHCLDALHREATARASAALIPGPVVWYRCAPDADRRLRGAIEVRAQPGWLQAAAKAPNAAERSMVGYGSLLLRALPSPSRAADHRTVEAERAWPVTLDRGPATIEP